MGVNTLIYLKPSMSTREICDVIGILKGAKKTKSSLTDTVDYIKVEHSQVKPSCVAECCELHLENGYYLLHYEPDYTPIEGARLIMPRSQSEEIAIGKRLVDIFGGYVVYQDTDDRKADYIGYPERVYLLNRDKEFDEWQNFLENLKPLTQKEIKDCEQYAAYK